MEPVTLRTSRLELTLPRDSDADAIFEACQDPGIQRYTPVPVPYEREHAEAFIAQVPKDWEAGRNLTWAIREDDELVGTIGLHMYGFGFTVLMVLLAIERRLLTAGENKGMLDPFSPVDEKSVAQVKEMLGEIHQQFIAVVKEGRGKRLKESPDIFSGLIWTGQKSIDLGLADSVGSLEYVAREVIKAEEIMDFTQKEGIAEKFAKRFGAAAANTFAEAFLRASIR